MMRDPLPEDSMNDAERRVYYEQMEADFAWQHDVMVVLNRIESDFPNDYAMARINPDKSFSIGFTGAAPAGALAQLATSTAPYTVTEHHGFTDAQLGDLGWTVLGVVNDLAPELESATVVANPETRVIEIMIGLGDNDAVGQAFCATVDPAAITAGVTERLAADGVPYFGFAIDVRTAWGRNIDAIGREQ